MPATGRSAPSRRLVLLALGGAAFAQDTRSVIAGVAGELAAALSAGAPAAFLKQFEPRMRGYARLETLIYALLDQAEVSCSIEVVKEEGEGARRSAVLDWMLSITGRQNGAAVEQRRANVTCVFEQRAGRWLVTSLEPIEFFAPPPA